MTTESYKTTADTKTAANNMKPTTLSKQDTLNTHGANTDIVVMHNPS